MAQPRYEARVRYRNELLLPTSLYPDVEVPDGVPCWQPFLVPTAEMVTLASDRANRYGYRANVSLDRFPSGYVRSDLDVRFENFDRQWRRDGDIWRFRGGTIHLRLTLAIYVDERARNRPRCLSMILSHELLHVADEIDLVTAWLPSRATAATANRLQSVHDNLLERAVKGTGAGGGSELERVIRELWIPQSSLRARELHRRRPDDASRIAECLGIGRP